MIDLYPAILTDSSETFERQIRAAERFAPLLHIDVTDGRFVPTRSVGVADLRAVAPNVPFEIHLMVERPEDVVADFLALGPKRIIVHKSATASVAQVCGMIRAADVEASIAVSPATLSDDITPSLHLVQQVTFLAVDPGFQGGALNAGVLQKARLFKHDHPEIPVEVDGGIKTTNWEQVLATAADRYVIGSGIWQTANPAATYQEFVRRATVTTTP
ncbi:MAG: hypothetical protein HY340_02300 [Candidatus Kerfeldbacteria bacterium]|nr:hypothetical protein [Candidatus Kerfeldbacteria bacterium]